MKLRRSDRMVVISNYLINNPYKLTSLNTFAEKYESAKSSISEDIVIIKRAFEEIEIGHIQTVTGAGGGVIFTPTLVEEDAKEILSGFLDKINDGNRLLAGGYIFMSDIIGDPSLMNKLGRVVATVYKNKEVDAVVTVATKGIPVRHSFNIK